MTVHDLLFEVIIDSGSSAVIDRACNQSQKGTGVELYGTEVYRLSRPRSNSVLLSSGSLAQCFPPDTFLSLLLYVERSVFPAIVRPDRPGVLRGDSCGSRIVGSGKKNCGDNCNRSPRWNTDRIQDSSTLGESGRSSRALVLHV